MESGGVVRLGRAATGEPASIVVTSGRPGAKPDRPAPAVAVSQSESVLSGRDKGPAELP